MTSYSERLAWRAIDANLNRASEGLRAVEEFVRFGENDLRLTTELKALRHRLTEASQAFPLEKLLDARDTPGDVGTALSGAVSTERADVRDAALANLKRVQQALRAIEEFAKVVSPAGAPAFERLRYESYAIEQRLVDPAGRRKRLADARLYLLLDVRGDLERVRRLAEETLSGGVDVIQLRDKAASDRDLLRAGEIVRKATLAAEALFIVNDRADLALALDADGVHVGQEELPVAIVRGLVGPSRLVGLSTHDLEQALAGEREGADYLGVGPTFPSRTKPFAAYPGIPLLIAAAGEVSLPWFAIGGIGAGNLAEVLAAGASRVAVSSALLEAQSPRAAARELNLPLRPAYAGPEG
ncbi:MAG TPA: thiamine phosphate synthase [Pirellulaceae bacterium]|jgi:thiamine-phosphate pyrophosphorylase|nr:thiamine phosphate synthase [Pirellulaceae bacterium]